MQAFGRIALKLMPDAEECTNMLTIAAMFLATSHVPDRCDCTAVFDFYTPVSTVFISCQ